eukprot:jgi/Tetstr1/464643/TSEL_009397.t1
MWPRLAEGLLPAYDQPQPSEAATDQPAATPADVPALTGVRAWAEYEANTDADDAVVCPPIRTLLALLEVREVWKARRSADSVRLELLDHEAARLLQDVCRDAVLALSFGDQSQGRSTDGQSDLHRPLANLELPTVEQLAKAIAVTISQRTNTPSELQHAQWLTDTMTAAGVEMYLHHTEPTLLRVGDDNMCAISLGKEDEEFADTLRLAVALTSSVALLRAIRLRTIVIYLIDSEFDPSELLIHPFSQTIRDAGELGGNTGHNQIRRVAIGLRKKARKTAPASLALRATGRPIYTLTLQLTAHHHSIIGGTRSTDIADQWRKTVSTVCGKIKAAPAPAPTERRSADTSPAPPPADPVQLPLPATLATLIAPQADDEEDLELNYEENDSAMEADTTQGEATETPYDLPVVGEEALVLAVTEAMYDRMNGHGHHMQGGLKPAMATFRGLSADLLVSFFEARPDMWHARLKVVKRAGYFHTRVVAAKEDTDMELPTGYSVGPSDPKARPFHTAFDDPKVYAMRELHALCEAHFMHPMDDSDAVGLCTMGWSMHVTVVRDQGRYCEDAGWTPEEASATGARGGIQASPVIQAP